jgi:hypothetical protein
VVFDMAITEIVLYWRIRGRKNMMDLPATKNILALFGVA